jgi:ribosomal protein L6P/L9E
MACNITTGRAKACKEFQGGVQSLYLFNFLENAFTVVDGEATAINPLLTEVFEYKVEGDGQTLVENMVSDRNTSTTVNTQTITAMLKGIDAETSAELNLVAKGYPMAVVRDRNGVYHAVGLDDGIDFTIDQATGGAKTDMNGYTITGVSTTGSLSPKLDSATITAFLALVD